MIGAAAPVCRIRTVFGLVCRGSRVVEMGFFCATAVVFGAALPIIPSSVSSLSSSASSIWSRLRLCWLPAVDAITRRGGPNFPMTLLGFQSPLRDVVCAFSGFVRTGMDGVLGPGVGSCRAIFDVVENPVVDGVVIPYVVGVVSTFLALDVASFGVVSGRKIVLCSRGVCKTCCCRGCSGCCRCC